MMTCMVAIRLRCYTYHNIFKACEHWRIQDVPKYGMGIQTLKLKGVKERVAHPLVSLG